MGDIQKTMRHALVGVLDIAQLRQIRDECKSINKDGEYLRLPGLLADVCDRALREFNARSTHAAAWTDSVCISVELKNREDAEGVDLTLKLLDRLVRDLDHEICKWAHGLLINADQSKKPGYLSELSGSHSADKAFVNATYGVIVQGQLFPRSETANANRNPASKGEHLHWLHASSWALANCEKIESTVRGCIKSANVGEFQDESVKVCGKPEKVKFYVDCRVAGTIKRDPAWQVSFPLYPNERCRCIKCYDGYLFKV